MNIKIISDQMQTMNTGFTRGFTLIVIFPNSPPLLVRTTPLQNLLESVSRDPGKGSYVAC